MNTKQATFHGGCAMLLAMAAIATAAEPLPYGHQDFVPTPEKPIFFRAGNGEYPGATPPLEWWEGTPVQRDGQARGKHADAMEAAKLWDCSDTKSKNLLWKAPVPGWGLSHPIVVGKKVFAVGEPDFVTCYDADTGTVLWQQRINPLRLDGMDEPKATAGQKVLDLARAFFYVGCQGGPSCGNQPGNVRSYSIGNHDNPSRQSPEETFARRREFGVKLVAMVERHRSEVEAFGDADLLAAADQDLAILRGYASAKDMAELDSRTKAKDTFNHLETACNKKLGVDIGGCWWGYVGSADSTLASDGQRIYGVFDQGQVFALDLDGKLVWGHREKGVHDNRGAFHRSPVLWRDLVLIRSRAVTGKGKGDDALKTLTAYETATGTVRWTVPFSRSNYTVPRIMSLKHQDGSDLDVVLGDAPVADDKGQPMIRLRDGKVLGHLPKHDCARGALLGIRGDAVIWSSTSDRGGGPTCCYRLKPEGADSVTAEKVYVLGETNRNERIFSNQHDFPTMLGDLWLYRDKGVAMYDALGAREVCRLPGTGRPEPGAVTAGRYLILPIDAGSANEPYGRPRDDRKAMLRYVVVDLADPAKPKVVSDKNLLGHADPPADIIMKNYLSAFDPYDFAGCYKGSASFFALMSGPVPHGSRLYIQSTAYLYCIGQK